MTSTSICSFLCLRTLSEPKSLFNSSGSHSIATKNTNNHTYQTNLQNHLISPIWTVTEIAESVNGKILKWGPPGTICTDTRDLKPGKNQWFFAVSGEHLMATISFPLNYIVNVALALLETEFAIIGTRVLFMLKEC
ncbi:hypothetical protein QYF36_003404 [Acer negundo]|nr:hypothetical protein QYF36_003404 [Acer negundo]